MPSRLTDFQSYTQQVVHFTTFVYSKSPMESTMKLNISKCFEWRHSSERTNIFFDTVAHWVDITSNSRTDLRNSQFRQLQNNLKLINNKNNRLWWELRKSEWFLIWKAVIVNLLDFEYSEFMRNSYLYLPEYCIKDLVRC